MFGNGQNLRSLSYIDDVVQGIILALQYQGRGAETFWVADAKPYTTEEIYLAVAEAVGVKDLKPRQLPAWVSLGCETLDGVLQSLGLYMKELHVAGEMARDIACSIDKARKILGFKPEVSLYEGMKRSVEWCRTHGQQI